MTDLEQAGIDAVDRFISTWNSRNADNWAASLNYPHVRPAPAGDIRVSLDAADYAAGVDFDKVLASGWDHSEWDYKHVLHTSPRRIHVAGQWSRYTVEGDIILTTPVMYVCTLVDGKWGVQSRFAADHADDDSDTTELQLRGLNLLQDFINRISAGEKEACAELLNYPHFAIGVGEIDRTDSPAEFALPGTRFLVDSLMAVQSGHLSMNAAVELTASGGGARHLQGVVHINDRDGHLGIQAWSLLDPDESVED